MCVDDAMNNREPEAGTRFTRGEEWVENTLIEQAFFIVFGNVNRLVFLTYAFFSVG